MAISSLSFQIVINADNFVYNDGKYTGGFAMIDDLEYNAQICSKTEPEDSHFVGNQKTSFLGSPESDLSEVAFLYGSYQSKKRSLFFQSIRIIQAPQDDTEACHVVDCNFRTGACMKYILESDFSIGLGPLGNPVTGIQGGTQANGSKSDILYGRIKISVLALSASDIAFAYAIGPKDTARFTLPPFTLHEARILRFSYYLASAESKLRVWAQRSKEREVVIFEAPDTDISSRRWIREAIPLKTGRYEKVRFSDLQKLEGVAETSFSGHFRGCRFEKECVRWY